MAPLRIGCEHARSRQRGKGNGSSQTHQHLPSLPSRSQYLYPFQECGHAAGKRLTIHTNQPNQQEASRLPSAPMDDTTRTFIKTQFLTITEVARLIGKSEAATAQEAYRKRWDYVLKGRQKLYYRGDVVLMIAQDRTPR